MESKKVTVQVIVNSIVENVWKCWTTENDILKWNHASDDWHTTKVVNDLKIGGEFSYRMEARDGSFGFDFGGRYDAVVEQKLLGYILGDGRKVIIEFKTNNQVTTVIQTFDAENENPIEMQQAGWQSIMNNFKKYVESLS